jgi:hypothetical protein
MVRNGVWADQGLYRVRADLPCGLHYPKRPFLRVATQAGDGSGRSRRPADPQPRRTPARRRDHPAPSAPPQAIITTRAVTPDTLAA